MNLGFRLTKGSLGTRTVWRPLLIGLRISENTESFRHLRCLLKKEYAVVWLRHVNGLMVISIGMIRIRTIMSLRRKIWSISMTSLRLMSS